jgi:hypothetical protein
VRYQYFQGAINGVFVILRKYGGWEDGPVVVPVFGVVLKRAGGTYLFQLCLLLLVLTHWLGSEEIELCEATDHALDHSDDSD